MTTLERCWIKSGSQDTAADVCSSRMWIQSISSQTTTFTAMPITEMIICCACFSDILSSIEQSSFEFFYMWQSYQCSNIFKLPILSQIYFLFISHAFLPQFFYQRTEEMLNIISRKILTSAYTTKSKNFFSMDLATWLALPSLQKIYVPKKNQTTQTDHCENYASLNNERRVTNFGSHCYNYDCEETEIEREKEKEYESEEREEMMKTFSQILRRKKDEYLENKLIKENNVDFVAPIELQKTKICKFNVSGILAHNRDSLENSQELNEIFGCFLKENQCRSITNLIQKYVKQEGFIPGLAVASNKKQKQLFKELRKLLNCYLEDSEMVEKLILKFSASDPRFITFNEIKNILDMQNMAERKKSYVVEKFEYTLLKSREMIKRKAVLEEEVKNNKQESQFLNMIKDEQMKIKPSSSKMKSQKLSLKKQTKQDINELETNQMNLQKVEKKIFGNKKMLKEQIIFKKVEGKRKIDKAHQRFGQNWVYIYDLPYDITEKDAENLILNLSKKHGKICEFYISPYKNMVQKSSEETIYVIPQNYLSDNLKKPARMDQIMVKVEENVQEQKKNRKNLITKMLEKTKNEKNLLLNKSVILAKFENHHDKVNFLTPEMRLYGLNLNKWKNIKFEEAETKRVVALSMIPWGCESCDLLKVINDHLLPLKISVSHPNCLIAKSYLFIELGNFYEAWHAKESLNNIIFQNQRLKAQLIYGSSQVSNGEYKFEIESDHYETLVQKLSEIRSQYSKDYQ